MPYVNVNDVAKILSVQRAELAAARRVAGAKLGVKRYPGDRRKFLQKVDDLVAWLQNEFRDVSPANIAEIKNNAVEV